MQTNKIYQGNCLDVMKNFDNRSKTFQGIANAMAEQWGNI